MQGPNPQDRAEIYELYARYSWALDTGDSDAYVALFAEDGEASEETQSGAIEVYRGHEEIRRLVRRFHERADFPGHQHQMAQLVFEPDPEDRPQHWMVRAYAWATISHPPQPPRLYWCGHVRDTVAKVDGDWKIRSKAIMGWAGEVLSHFPSAQRFGSLRES